MIATTNTKPTNMIFCQPAKREATVSPGNLLNYKWRCRISRWIINMHLTEFGISFKYSCKKCNWTGDYLEKAGVIFVDDRYVCPGCKRDFSKNVIKVNGPSISNSSKKE